MSGHELADYIREDLDETATCQCGFKFHARWDIGDSAMEQFNEHLVWAEEIGRGAL